MSVGKIIGGALQGIGAGMMAQTQSDMEARRAQALENLRSANNMAEIKARGAEQRDTDLHQGDITDRNNARQVQRQTNATIVTDTAKTQNDIKLEGVKFANDKSMAAFKAGLDRSNEAASQQLKAYIEQGVVSEVVDGGDGQQYVVFKDGRTMATGIKVAPKSSDGILGGLPASNTATTPPTKTPLPKPAAQKPGALPEGWSVNEVKKK